jgi:maltooligosyltrehalose trehalohydrolase
MNPPCVAFPGCTFDCVGAHVHGGGVTYRVWAPEADVVNGEGGFHQADDVRGAAGDLYWLTLDGGERLPDPASRFQPQGVDGPSQVVDATQYRWSSEAKRPAKIAGRVIYELHLGTFTPAGTYRAAIEKLDALVELGVNTIELMPVAEFAGRWNWGYDGVLPFAPTHSYGQPDDLRALIDAAHARGLAVILDVVYNHLGPCGNVLPRFSPRYFHPERASVWGQALNFDGPESAAVRQYFLQNVCMWLDEYRIDGLRLDAVHAIVDESTPHIVAQFAEAAQERGAFVIAEDDRNDARIITPRDKGGWGLDGMWSDDFHHTVRVALTGDRHAHFANYSGRSDEWVETLRQGWLYQGQHYPSWNRPRGTPAHSLAPEQFVFCISNHDQVGNRPLGDRLHEAVSPEAYRAVSMLLCLAPFTPMLFMGQEWAATSPFPFFTDHPGEVGVRMAENRTNEFRHYGAYYSAELLARMPDPQDERTFRDAHLNWDEREREPHGTVLALYRECLSLRAREPLFQNPPRRTWSVQKIGTPGTIGLRWKSATGDWLLLARLRSGPGTRGEDAFAKAHAERKWTLILSSEEKRFGGNGLLPILSNEGKIEITGPAAALFREET